MDPYVILIIIFLVFLIMLELTYAGRLTYIEDMTSPRLGQRRFGLLLNDIPADFIQIYTSADATIANLEINGELLPLTDAVKRVDNVSKSAITEIDIFKGGYIDTTNDVTDIRSDYPIGHDDILYKRVRMIGCHSPLASGSSLNSSRRYTDSRHASTQRPIKTIEFIVDSNQHCKDIRVVLRTGTSRSRLYVSPNLVL